MHKLFVAILVCSLAGLVASAVMTRMHFGLTQGGFEEKSFCNVSEFVDCDTALASRYAKIGGVPTSEFGFLYYLFFTLAALYAWASEAARRATLSFLLAGSVLALGYSLIMAYLSFFRLGVLCLLCLTTYLGNLALIVLVPAALGIRLFKIPAYLAEYARSIFGKGEISTRIGFHLISFFLLMGVGLLFFKGMSPSLQAREMRMPDGFYLTSFRATAPTEFGLTEANSWGPPDAKVTVIEFSDFQCPFCKRAAFSLKPYLGELRKEIRFIYVNYPLDLACNPSVKHAMHPVSCLAAKAALCAGQKGKFWEFHDLVFENQKRLSRTTLMNLGKKVGLEETWLNVCLIAPETEARLNAEIREGEKFQVSGTPAIFINGRPFRDWLDPERLRLVVASELKGH